MTGRARNGNAGCQVQVCNGISEAGREGAVWYKECHMMKDGSADCQ